MVHRDNSGNEFITLSTAQFIVAIIVLIVSIIGIGYNMHSRIYASVITSLKEGDERIFNETRETILKHDESIIAHLELQKIRNKQMEEIKLGFKELRDENRIFKDQIIDAVHKLDKKIR